MTRKQLGGVIGVVAFASGFVASAVYPCTRIQATCSYAVTWQYCGYNGCDSCDRFGAPCCYEESGACNDDPYHQGYSQICFGICAGGG